MARFRLREKHYLAVVGSEWEYKETLSNGKQKRIVMPVPMFLDPNDPSDCNYPGEILVSTKEDPLYPKDYIFTGPCTPDMEPLDAEAKELSSTVVGAFIHPINSLPAVGGHQPFGDQLLKDLERKIDALHSPSVANGSIDDLRMQVASLTAQVQGLLALVPAKALDTKASASSPIRRPAA